MTNIIIIIFVVVVVVVVIVVVGDNTYCGVTCPPTVHFKFITKCDRYECDRTRCPSSKDSQKVTVERRSGRCPCGISSCVAWIPNNRQITFRGN